MNGDLTELFNKLSVKIVEVKTRNEVLWQQHDERSKDLKNEMTTKFNVLFKEIKELREDHSKRPCGVHATQISNAEKNHTKLWGLFWGVFVLLVGIGIKAFLFS